MYLKKSLIILILIIVFVLFCLNYCNFYENFSLDTKNYLPNILHSNPREGTSKLKNKQYFPNPINGHYDPRFFKRKCKNVTGELYKLFYKFNSFYKGEYWLAYGTLLGGVRHNGIIPWDDDIDLHVWAKDLRNNPNFETSEYIWFVVPTAYSEKLDPLNGIDARLISKKTGLFIDIMAVHQIKNQVLIKTEHIGRYRQRNRTRTILPFLEVKFDKIRCKVPNDYKDELHSWYGKNCLTHDANNKLIKKSRLIECPK